MSTSSRIPAATTGRPSIWPMAMATSQARRGAVLLPRTGDELLLRRHVALYQALTGRPVAEPSYDENNWPRDHDNRNVIRLIRLSQAHPAGPRAGALLSAAPALLPGWRSAFAVAALASLLPAPGALLRTIDAREPAARRPDAWPTCCPPTSEAGVLEAGRHRGPLGALRADPAGVRGARRLPLGFILLQTRNVAPAAKRCAVVGACFLLTVLPWLHKVYTFYPDVRIARSMGCALTSDWIQFKTSLRFADSRHPRARVSGRTTSADELLSMDMYAFTARECFDNAFNGTFRRTAGRWTRSTDVRPRWRGPGVRGQCSPVPRPSRISVRRLERVRKRRSP